MTLARLLCTLLLALPQAAAAGSDVPPGADLSWWTTHSLEKVLPAHPPGARRPVSLHAARNEFEAFQLVLRARSGPIGGVDVEATELVSASDNSIAARHVAVYLERFLPLRVPSSRRGGVGEWPDPLVPRVDTYTGERRGGFPFELQPGRNQPLWIEVYVPPATVPGVYRGTVRVSVGGAESALVPVELRVWAFELPSTSTLRTSYGLSGVAALRQHRGGYTSDEDLYEITGLYERAALRHRISVHGASMVPPPAEFRGERVRVDWRSYDREMAPLLDGTAFGAGDPLPGARATSVDLRTPPDLEPAQQVLYWREWSRHFRDRGWLDRLFYYVWDEPAGTRDYRSVLRLGLRARSADARLRTLLTEQLVPELSRVIDIWVTLVNCIEDRPGVESPCERTVPRSAYQHLRRPGASVWWYQSCASHGCDTVGDESFEGWPSYVVDAPALAHRVMPWLAWLYDVEGELYYNTVEAYRLVDDPWLDVHTHGGNGDGTLFYPGTPERIGGSTHVPIESLRLKVIRDGLEDHEYLVLLERAGHADLARRWARTVARRTYEWTRRPEALHSARVAIGTRLHETMSGEERGKKR
jgi:hypothetical protein